MKALTKETYAKLIDISLWLKKEMDKNDDTEMLASYLGWNSCLLQYGIEPTEEDLKEVSDFMDEFTKEKGYE